jgi:BirA family biotin operon repressor/biotin-[acetyl-CoA-carboxylase] ligase
LSHKQELDNFTVVIAEKQTKGKGQMGSVWEAEEGKNLIVSVFIKDPLLNINQIYNQYCDCGCCLLRR